MNLNLAEFNQIRKFLKEQCGVALSDQKGYLVQGRLEPLLRKYGMKDFRDVVLRFREPGQGGFRDEVVEAMVTNETSFHRDTHPYEELKSSILPLLAERVIQRRRSGLPFPKLRIWSAAASTGQEAYSIAMTILDFLEGNPHRDLTVEHFSILASDISEKVLKVAREGIYHEVEMERGLSDRQRDKYFTATQAGWQIHNDVKKMIEFRRINVVQSISDMLGFDLIFCRNLLIYFDEPTRVDVLRKLARSLLPGGFLVIGAAENLPQAVEPYFDTCRFGESLYFVRRYAATIP